MAIGAPWEDEGRGTVYIYLGNGNGFSDNYIQRITSEHDRGFGISISKYDVNGDLCNGIVPYSFNLKIIIMNR